MYKDLLEQLNNIPKQYDEAYRAEKEMEMRGYREDIRRAEILNELINHQYIKDLIKRKREEIERIDEEIIRIALNLSNDSIRKIQTLQGKKSALQDIIRDLTPPDISSIKKVIEEELKYIKNNGQ